MRSSSIENMGNASFVRYMGRIRAKARTLLSGPTDNHRLFLRSMSSPENNSSNDQSVSPRKCNSALRFPSEIPLGK